MATLARAEVEFAMKVLLLVLVLDMVAVMLVLSAQCTDGPSSFVTPAEASAASWP